MIKFVSKPWGFEKWIHNDEKYCGKILYIVKDHGTSLHYHKQKYETLYVQSGVLKINFFNKPVDNKHLELLRVNYLRPGDIFEIIPGMTHSLTALEDCVILEFSTQHFDEDSIRILPGG